jgi:hypothetical protein
MRKNTPAFTLDDQDQKSPPLTTAEKAAIKRARADVKAGRVYDHDEVAKRLRRRAADIVTRANKSDAKPR